MKSEVLLIFDKKTHKYPDVNLESKTKIKKTLDADTI